MAEQAEFDWQFAEEQFAYPTNYERRPDKEVYGRSLSTIYRLGVCMVKNTFQRAVRSPEADQVREEFYTSVEEGFGTDVDLGETLVVRDFDDRPILDGRVMSKDLKTPISDMTLAGLICAEKTDRKDKRFRPQLIRSRWDHNNARIVDHMASGETDYNTRIVVSPYPEEADAESGSAYWRKVGYVPHLKRGFVQLYHAGESGLVSGSLSFDGSNKDKLIELFASYGVNIPESEKTDNWLKYAITDTLSEDQAKALATRVADLADDPNFKPTNNQKTNTVTITSEHRQVMDTVFNESYVHACESLATGKQTLITQKLVLQLANQSQHFNEHYRDSLYKMRANKNQFTDDDMAVLHELLVYSAIEMMRAFHLSGIDQLDNTPVSSLVVSVEDLNKLSSEAFQAELGSFAAEGASNSRTYSACGLAISPGETNKNDNGPQTAFGGNADSSSSSETCVYSHSNCYCSPYNEDGSSRTSNLTVKAKRDRTGTAYCLRSGCHAKLHSDGSGDIGQIARKAKQIKQSTAMSLSV
jgi:hypothetical protein